MIITKLQISKLRNHIYSEIYPATELNIFYGENGAGKTTVLEAISIACLSKSFANNSDSSLIQTNENQYQIKLESLNHLNLPYNVEVLYQIGQRKKINNTFGDNQTPKDIIGLIPLVHLSPDLRKITTGSPESRREFIDKILSQSSKSYLDILINFRKALKQRSSLLYTFQQTKRFDTDFFETWNNVFLDLASQIIIKRHNFIIEFSKNFQQIYSEITQNKETVSLQYEPNSIPDDIYGNNSNSIAFDEIFNILKNKSKSMLSAEVSRGMTLFGPQKDELKITLNSGLAREKGSQGQHKSLLIAIKFAELEYLAEKTNEIPIVLLDDIFSELDDNRISLVLKKVIDRKSQTFITLTNPEIIMKNNNLTRDLNYYYLNNGKIELK
ncbi:MAG: DNA replication/repair protein RecF [Candidatus Kapaibacteriota bacterium]